MNNKSERIWEEAAFAERGKRKQQNITQDSRTEIWTQHLPNMKHEC
jgi:hypothetical protein